jgi:hypothetical protein
LSSILLTLVVDSHPFPQLSLKSLKTKAIERFIDIRFFELEACSNLLQTYLQEFSNNILHI